VSERILTQRELNRALLARQLLLERATMSIPRAAEQIGTIQTQYAPSAYVALWTRLHAFERDALTRALERAQVVQATMMRNTIHIATPSNYWPLVIAIRPERMAWSRRIQKAEPQELERAARRLRTFLADGPRRQAEIVEKLGDEVWRPGIGIWLDLVRVPPSGTWERRRADLYGLADEWVGPEPELDHQAAVKHLVRRYLGAFGPAPRVDIADWAGMRVGTLKNALDRMRLRRFRDEQGRELLDLPREPLPHPETPAPPRFLPVWDATLLVHARRTGILPEEYRPRIFNTRTPHSFNTFLVDGRVAGAWRYENDRVEIEPFERIPRDGRKALDEEAERLSAFMRTGS
jgi:hypothetical protein